MRGSTHSAQQIWTLRGRGCNIRLFCMEDGPREGGVKVFSSFKEAEEADTAYYASLSPQERVDFLLDIVAQHLESTGEAAKGFERVYRVIELSQS